MRFTTFAAAAILGMGLMAGQASAQVLGGGGALGGGLSGSVG